MAGRILNVATRKDILKCQLVAISFAENREALVAIWKASKLIFGNGGFLDEIVIACSKRQDALLGIRSIK